MLNTDKYIWKVKEVDVSDGDMRGWEAGWYFQDETEQLNGPYSSRQEATDALNAYVP